MATPLRKPKRKRDADKLGDARASAGIGAAAGAGTTIHSLEPEEGELFQHDPNDVSPNPMNRRFGLRDMEAMKASVARQGVHTPGAAMHTRLFMEMYPEWADKVPHPERTYILGPGHRRHTAALETGQPMLLILRDSWARERTVEENLISENDDRDGLSPIEQALQLDLLRARGFTGEQIAERTGYGARGTVTRFLNLLDLPEELRDEIHAGKLSAKAGYTLSTIKDEDGNRDSPAAHELQLRAFGWMRAEGISADMAKKRLTLTAVSESPTASIQAPPAEAEAPASPADDEELPPAAQDVSPGKHDAGGAAEETAREAAPGIPHQSERIETTSRKGPQKTKDAEPDPAKDAAKARDRACRLLLSEERYASAAETTAHLVAAVLNAGEWAKASKRAHAWLRETGKGPEEARAREFFEAIASGGDANLMRRAAFAVSLAADEVRAAERSDWDDRDRAHVEFLITSKVAYQPTEWERQQLGMVSPGKH